MEYLAFFEKLKMEDARIEYREVHNVLEYGNLKIPQFYEEIDPVNVEFELNDGIVRLEPFGGLPILNEHHGYVKADCVFASCNGDPIYVKNNKVYSCIHGSKRIIEEEIAESVDALFEMVCNNL